MMGGEMREGWGWGGIRMIYEVYGRMWDGNGDSFWRFLGIWDGFSFWKGYIHSLLTFHL